MPDVPFSAFPTAVYSVLPPQPAAKRGPGVGDASREYAHRSAASQHIDLFHGGSAFLGERPDMARAFRGLHRRGTGAQGG